MTEQRNSGSTKRLIEVLEANRGVIFSNQQLAAHAEVKLESVNKLLASLRNLQPDLRLEQPTRGSWVYRGWRDETNQTVTETPARPVKAADKPKTIALTAGDVCEVIGFSQDTTPIVRDGYGKLYLLQQL